MLRHGLPEGVLWSLIDPSSPVGCDMELLWIETVGPAHPTDAQLD